MRKISVCFFAALLLSLKAAAGVIGYAYDETTATLEGLLYTEQYRYLPTHHEVVYRNVQGTAFAKKSMHYKLSLQTPEIVFSNQNCQESYHITPSVENADKQPEASNNKNSIKHSIDVKYGNACADKNVNKRWDINQPYVIDAGFDYFVQQNLSLIQQEKIIFSYVLPSRGRDVLLSARSIPCEGLARRFSEHLNNIQELNSVEKNWDYCVWVKPNSKLVVNNDLFIN